jgi:Cd2+/Zn2+-exporting ATPase
MKNSGKTIIFAGDGVNDAPSLAKSDVSISVLSESAIALEAGDLTMISDSLMAIPYVIKTAKHTMRVIYTNIWFSLLVKLIVLLLATIGIAPIWLALFADVGVLILTVLNSLSVVKA